MEIIIIALAYAMDLVFGDPRWLPHPVKIIGKTIEKTEKSLRKIKNEKFAGLLLVLIIPILTYIITFGTIELLSRISMLLAYVVSAIFIYTTLSIKDLAKEGLLVYEDLKNNDVNKARKDLSMIVGRDTQNLDEPEIIRATVETIAESTVDGIVSPLFYVFLGTVLFGLSEGVAFGLTYKAINTLDSMVGYKNEKYKNFGYFSAKIDSWINYIPAIITAVCISISAMFVAKTGKNAFRMSFKEGVRTPEKNSEFPESAMAGSLLLRLGGTNYYNGVMTVKPYLGDASFRHTGTIEDIGTAVKIMYASSFIALAIGITLTICS